MCTIYSLCVHVHCLCTIPCVYTLFTCLIDNFDSYSVHKTCVDCMRLLRLHASIVQYAIEEATGLPGSKWERPTMERSIIGVLYTTRGRQQVLVVDNPYLLANVLSSSAREDERVLVYVTSHQYY